MKQKGKFVNRFAYKDIKSETGYKDIVNPARRNFCFSFSFLS